MKTDKPGSKVIDKKLLAKERKKGFKITRIEQFRNQTHYFSASGIIGSRAFVSRHYRMFKDRYKSKNEKLPNPISGLDGMFALKRLSESSS